MNMKLLIISSLLGSSLAYEYNENKPSQLNCDCGWRNEKIEGGEDIKDIRYPWLAVLMKSSKFLCAATIITEYHVLTASYCMKKAVASELTICVGVMKGKECFSRHQVEQFYNKWRFTSNDAIKDIAIVSSETNFEFNSFVGPICIPNKHMDNLKLKNNYVNILTWGRADSLKEMKVAIVDLEKCYQISRKVDRSSHICTYQSGQYTCEDDRGAPIVYIDSVAERYFLLGMVTHSPYPCNEINYKPTLSTNVSAYLHWMRIGITDKRRIRWCSKFIIPPEL